LDQKSNGVPAATRAERLKSAALAESKHFIAIFLYLAVVFGIFVLHSWVVLEHEHIAYRFYGIAFINALVLAKIFLLADHFHFAEQFRGKPLIVPILYKSLAFTLLLCAAYVIEGGIVGLFHRETFWEAMPKPGNGSIEAWVFVAALIFFALIPLFAYRELARALGPATLRALLLGK
jgi:hypothetical protein